MTTKLKIEIPEEFGKFMPAAIVRLSYLYPGGEFTSADGAVVVALQTGEQADEIKREVMHQIYRERIYSETLSVRRWLSED